MKTDQRELTCQNQRKCSFSVLTSGNKLYLFPLVTIEGSRNLEARVTAREPAFDRVTNRVDLTMQVTEGPLTQIEFAGRQTLPEKSLRERLTFADSGLVDEVEVRSSTEQVQRAYREAGYNFARVSGTLGGDATTRVVKFDIEEGPRVIVERITLEGATTLPASHLRDRLETRPKGLLTRGLFVEETLARDSPEPPALLTVAGLRRRRGGAAAHHVQ